MRIPLPSRIPILYLILCVLIAVGVVPLYFYATKVLQLNREALTRNERLMQNTVTSSLAQDILQQQKNVHSILSGLAFSVDALSGGNIDGMKTLNPEVQKLMSNVVESPDSIVPYIVLTDRQGHGVGTGTGVIALDDFLKNELSRGVAAAQDGREYTGEPVSVSNGRELKTVMVMGTPVAKDGNYVGTLELILDLRYIARKLGEAKSQGLDTFVVDHTGRLVVAANGKLATGLDMRANEMVKRFVEQDANTPLVVTGEFMLAENKNQVAMLGTYDPVPGLGWAVVAQKPRTDAYKDAIEVQRTGVAFAMLAVGISILVAIFFARRLTTPLQVLTESSRAIAGGDFTKRVHVKSLTEIGELAQTFNTMTDDLQQFVQDMRKAAEENKALFLSSIQMLAGAVDEKDPYTKGHSDRVTRYSVIIATELGLSTEEIEKIRISAQLHDVGKIGIEDRILKKPGALTPEEFEVMKTHTTKGAAILRPVSMLKDMLPGIELHHESLDGRGYPFGLKGDQLPLMPRIIMVADTFDAMTTNRPYQAAMDAEYVIRIINSLAATKFDPKVVAAMTRVFEGGKLRLHRAATVTAEQAAAAGALNI
jgi:HD-GYP domain-containing protein (c-di-GMP phosphodiesterase class II)